MTTSSPKKQILWLEDEPEFIQHRVELLEDEGFRIDLICSVGMLKDYLKKKKYDLIILDIMMAPEEVFPEKKSHSGIITGKLAYTNIIKKHAPDTPVIVLTALSDGAALGKEIREQLEGDEQVKAYLIKPSSITELLDKINAALWEAQP